MTRGIHPLLDLLVGEPCVICSRYVEPPKFYVQCGVSVVFQSQTWNIWAVLLSVIYLGWGFHQKLTMTFGFCLCGFPSLTTRSSPKVGREASPLSRHWFSKAAKRDRFERDSLKSCQKETDSHQTSLQSHHQAWLGHMSASFQTQHSTCLSLKYLTTCWQRHIWRNWEWVDGGAACLFQGKE